MYVFFDADNIFLNHQNVFPRVLCSSQHQLQSSHFATKNQPNQSKSSQNLPKSAQNLPKSEACVPSYFLLGKRLHTPCFPVTCTGLRLGHAAWRALYDAVAVDGGEGAKRRNRFTSLQRGMSQEDLQDSRNTKKHGDYIRFSGKSLDFSVGKGIIFSGHCDLKNG